MNKEKTHLQFKKNNSYFIHILIALIPLIFYGFYKNGILPFFNQRISFLGMLKPLILPSIGAFAGIVSNYISKRKDKQNCYLYPYYGIILGMILPIQVNTLLAAILIITLLCLFRYFQVKKISPLFFTIIVFFLLFELFMKVPYQNLWEMEESLKYSMIDIFWGRNIGGVSTTSIFLCLLGLIYLSFDYYYKKEIAIYILVSFIVTSTLFEFIIPSGDLIQAILNSSVFFASVFVASEIKHSPYMEKSKIMYGILIGILGFICVRFISKEMGIYISVCCIHLLLPLLNKLAIIMEEKKTSFVEQ